MQMVPWPRKGCALIRAEPGHKRGLATGLHQPRAPFLSRIHSAARDGPSARAAPIWSLLTGIKDLDRKKRKLNSRE